MAQTSKAQTDKDLLTRLADRGEQVVGRITDLPGAKQLIDTTGALAKRMDTMQKQLRSLDPLQKRVTAIEHRLDKLESKETTRRRTTTRKTTAAKAKSTTSRSSGSKS